MKRFFLIFFIIGALHAQNILPSKQTENIKVLLEKDAKEALLEVKGRCYIFDPKDRSGITSG